MNALLYNAAFFNDAPLIRDEPMSSTARLLKRLLLALLMLTASTQAIAQADSSDTAEQPAATFPDNRQSPRDVMFAFLEAISEIEAGDTERWPEVYALLGEPNPEPEFTHPLKRYAVKLKQTLDYIGKVEPDELPGKGEADADYVVYFPQVFNDTHEQAVRDIGRDDLQIGLRRDESTGLWSFAQNDLDELHVLLIENRDQQYESEDYASNAKLIARFMPESLKGGTLLGLIYWQWVALAALILLGVILDQIIRTLLRGVTVRRIRRSGGEVKPKHVNAMVKPFGFVAAGILIMLGLSTLGLPDLAYRFLHGAAAVFTVLAGILAAWQLIDLIASVVIAKAEKTATKFDDILVPMICKAAKIFAVAIGIVYGAQALNLPIVPLLGSLGIGSLAFAFAAKDTIENFFGSVAVILDRPFEVGDWVVIGDTEGTVEELGFRSTRIRTFYNSQITVPNATLVRATVDNYGRRKYRRWKTHVGVQYDTPPDKLIAFTGGIRELVRQHPYTRKDYFQVWMHQWSASSMDILLYIFFEVPDWSTELRERERMFIDIVRLADKLGVQFAFPTQTVHLYKEEHKPYEMKHETPGATADRRAMVNGFRIARELVKDQAWQTNRPGPVNYSPDNIKTLLDEAGNETLVEKENKAEPTGDEHQTPPK